MNRDMDGAMICGTTVQSVGPLAKWPGANPRLPWFLDVLGYRGKLGSDILRAAYKTAWQCWANVFEIDVMEAANASDALIRAHFAPIDGPSSTLAWSYLADNTNSPKVQRYDAGESWTVEWEATGIPLVTVAIHEIGHVLGLDHDSSNANAIMRPSVSRSLPRPTERDFQRLAGLGYKRRTTPVPPPPPPYNPPDPPPVGGLQFPLPGGGLLTADYGSKLITYPQGWVGRAQ